MSIFRYLSCRVLAPLRFLHRMEKRIMSKLDELAVAIQSQSADVATLVTSVGAQTDAVTSLTNVIAQENQAIDAAIAALGGSSTDPAVQALIDAVNTSKANIEAATANVNTAVTTTADASIAAQAAADRLRAAIPAPPEGGGPGADAVG